MMLPSSLFQLLSAISVLFLSTGSVLASSGGVVPVTTQNGSPLCKPSTCKPKATSTSQAQHSNYCMRYTTYCSMFTGGNADDRRFYDLYCSPDGPLNSCRTYPSGKVGARSNSGQGHNFGSFFKVRADPTGNLAADNLDVDTSDDILYTALITMGGQNFKVLLDTGSSDLWLYAGNRSIQLTNTTDLVTSETYGNRRVEGTIKFADLQIGAASIEQQAFLLVTDADANDFDMTSYDGILGMAFDVGSIHGKVEEQWGAQAANHRAHSPMTALFADDSFSSNFDLQLFRSAVELDDAAAGFLAISSHVAGYESVASAPKLSRVTPEHWSVVMDEMIINGQSFSFNQSCIAGVDPGKVVATLDTGSSFSSLPPVAIDAIYGSVPGARYDDNSQVWLVPCNRSPNVTFVFGGQQFPIHPLDLTFPTISTLPINGQWDTDVTECINAFQYLPTEPSSSDGFDILLAHTFLHNVYASFNYGDWNPVNNTEGTPFVQMTSTTDGTTMWREFHANRTATLAQLPLPLDPASVVQYEAGPTPTGPTSSVATSSTGATQAPDSLAANLSGAVSADQAPGSADNDSWGNKYAKVVLALLAANLAVGIALLVAVLTMCARRRKEMSASRSTRYAPVRFKEPVEDYGRSSVMSSR